MTLAEFIATKPSQLRLGQHFVNAYWDKNMYSGSSELYYIHSDYFAEIIIIQLMQDWQWTTLPDRERD